MQINRAMINTPAIRGRTGRPRSAGRKVGHLGVPFIELNEAILNEAKDKISIENFDKTKFQSFMQSEKYSVNERVRKVIEKHLSSNFIALKSVFSHGRLCNWLEHSNGDYLIYDRTGDMWITNHYKKNGNTNIVLNIKPYDCIRKIKEDVYYIKLTESLYDQYEAYEYIVFIGNNWTEKRIVDFVVSFSKILKVTWDSFQETQKDSTGFDNLFLPEGVIADFKKDIESFLSSRDEYVKDLKLAWKRGYMLIGPPGNGKTLTIRSICKYYGLNFSDIKNCIAPDGSIGLDSSPDNNGYIDTILYPDNLPVVYILEDIDKFTVFQSGSYDHKDSGDVSLHNLLKGIDGMIQTSGIMLFATTNYANELSEALVNRPGRFDRIFEINKPELPEILKLLKYHNMIISGESLDTVAKELVGYSMAFAEEFVKSAKMIHKSNKISMEQAKIILDRIHKHDKMYKQHFEQDKPSIGFKKD